MSVTCGDSKVTRVRLTNDRHLLNTIRHVQKCPCWESWCAESTLGFASYAWRACNLAALTAMSVKSDTDHCFFGQFWQRCATLEAAECWLISRDTNHGRIRRRSLNAPWSKGVATGHEETGLPRKPKTNAQGLCWQNLRGCRRLYSSIFAHRKRGSSRWRMQSRTSHRCRVDGIGRGRRVRRLSRCGRRTEPWPMMSRSSSDCSAVCVCVFCSFAASPSPLPLVLRNRPATPAPTQHQHYTA